MSRKLAEYKGEQIVTGLFPGFVPVDAPIWEDGQNVMFVASGVHSVEGRSQVSFASGLFDSEAGNFDDHAGLFDDAGETVTPMDIGETSKITGLMAVKLSTGAPRICAGTLTKLFTYEGGATGSTSGFTGRSDAQLLKQATYWSMTNFGNWVLATNGIEVPQICKAGPGFVALGGVTFTTAEIFRKLGQHIVAFNTSNGSNYAEWSAEGEPEQWDPGTYPTAGRLPLQDLENEIVAVESLGNAGLAVYTLNEMQVLQYIGSGTFTFGARLTGVGFGAASKNSIVPVGGVHYGIEQNGVFRTDGSQFEVISYPQLGMWLDEVNWEQRGKIAGWHSRQHGLVHWALPFNGSLEPNCVLSYDYRAKYFTKSDLMFSVGTEAGVFPRPILGLPNGKVVFGEDTNDDLGSPIVRWIRTKPLDGGDAQMMKYIDVIKASIKVTSGNGPLLRVRPLWDLTDDSLANLPWYGPFALEEQYTTYKLDGFDAPYFQLEFRSIGLDERWQIGSFSLYGELTGRDW